MPSPHGYELLDLGDERRLERFGDRVVDRPLSTAIAPRRSIPAWSRADLRFDRESGWAAPSGNRIEPWTMEVDGLTFELRPAAGGQVGWFPEHQEPGRWLAARARERSALGTPPRILNLFAYTGAATVAIAAAGGSVTHVDSARTSVAWARRNARLSGLAEAPIRWIVDDVVAFVRREARRERRYDGVVLDPPSYGHGRPGVWRIAADLPALLEACASLLVPDDPFVMLTAHTPGFDPDHLTDLLVGALETAPARVESGSLELMASSGVRLRAGAFARWPG